MAVIHSLRSSSRHASSASVAVGAQPAAMFVNAATGSAKNIAPKQLTTTSNPPGSKGWIWASAWTKSTLVSPSAAAAGAGDGEHGRRQVDAEHVAVDGDAAEVAGRPAGAAADVEHAVGAPDEVAVEEALPDRRADALEPVGVRGPVLAFVAVPGGGLLGVGGVDGISAVVTSAPLEDDLGGGWSSP